MPMHFVQQHNMARHGVHIRKYWHVDMGCTLHVYTQFYILFISLTWVGMVTMFLLWLLLLLLDILIIRFHRSHARCRFIRFFVFWLMKKKTQKCANNSSNSPYDSLEQQRCRENEKCNESHRCTTPKTNGPAKNGWATTIKVPKNWYTRSSKVQQGPYTRRTPFSLTNNDVERRLWERQRENCSKYKLQYARNTHAKSNQFHKWAVWVVWQLQI